MANWFKEYRTHIISIVLSLSVAWTGATLIESERSKSQDCSTSCIVNGTRMVCSEDKCELHTTKQKGEQEQEQEQEEADNVQ